MMIHGVCNLGYFGKSITLAIGLLLASTFKQEFYLILAPLAHGRRRGRRLIFVFILLDSVLLFGIVIRYFLPIFEDLS